MPDRRSVLRCGAAALATSALRQVKAADDYPSRTLTLFVQVAPGGIGDVTARVVGQAITKQTGQSVVVENRPVPVVGAAMAAKAKPDGYTLLETGNGSAVTEVLFASRPYDLMKDFVHVSTMAFFDMAILVQPDSPFKTVADALAYAKAKPGKLSVGSARVGSTQNLAAELFRAMGGVNVVLVPYKSPGDLVAALHSNDIQLSFELLPPILSQIGAKNLRALAVTSTRRSPSLPDVPTVAESGIPGFEASSWNGVSLPAATPRTIVDRLAKEIQTAVASPAVQKALSAIGAVAEASTPEQMTERLRQDIIKWRAVIEKAGIPRQ